MRRIRRHLTYANVMVTLLAFIVLTGGTAVALNGSNTVQSDDLGPGAQVRAPDVAANAVNGSDVVNDSLTGADVRESSLGQVPSALLGGLGRSDGANTCDPEDPPGDYFPCAVITLNTSRQARFLVIGQGQATREGPTASAMGNCRLATSAGPISGSDAPVVVDAGSRESFSTAAVTGPFPPGQRSFRLECREFMGSGGILFPNAGVTAVAISPG